MSEVQELRNEIKLLRQDFSFVVSMLKAVLPDAGKNLWMSEEDVMIKTGLAKKTLQQKRKAGLLQARYGGKGRKVQYNRKSVEDYLKDSARPTRTANIIIHEQISY
jgi:hypothetical protein